MIRVGERRYSVLGRILIFLYHHRHVQNNEEWFSVGGLTDETGCSYGHVAHQASRWREWGFLEAQVMAIDGRPCYVYRVGPKGTRFVKDLMRRQPEWFERYRFEVAEYRRLKGLNAPTPVASVPA